MLHICFLLKAENQFKLTAQEILEKITDKTKAVVAVDFTGQAVENDAIRKICEKYKKFA